MKRLILVLLLALLAAAPVLASDAVNSLDMGDLHRLDFSAGGAFYHMRVSPYPIRPIITAGLCVPRIPLANGTTDTLGFSATVARTATFNSASRDSLTKGGVMARQVKVTWYSGTAADLAAGTITLVGKDIKGNTVSETFTITADAVGSGASVYAYSELTSLTIPVADAARTTCVVSIGRATGVGLPFTNVLKTPTIRFWLNGEDATNAVKDSMSVDATVIGKNFIKPITAANLAEASRNWDFLFWIPTKQGLTGTAKW